jgi:hypothetical protein
MVDVFISWSGDRSEALAQLLCAWLPKVARGAKPWMSSIDLRKGYYWDSELRAALQTYQFSIACVTRENLFAPWLAFEAGAISVHRGGRVIPLLLGVEPDEVCGPLKMFQCVSANKRDFEALIRDLAHADGNADENSSSGALFEAHWSELSAAIDTLCSASIANDELEISRFNSALARNNINHSPSAVQLVFETGFDTHAMYAALIAAASKRILVFGRGNRKLFDKDNKSFFQQLPGKIANGFDLRIMFLDPNSPAEVIWRAHSSKAFDEVLRSCLTHALGVLQGAGVQGCCRLYSTSQTAYFVIADDIIFYSPIRIDSIGRAMPLTNSPFVLLGVSGAMGRQLIMSFEDQWSNGKPVVGIPAPSYPLGRDTLT